MSESLFATYRQSGEKKSTWQHLQTTLRDGNPEDVSVALRIVLQLEGVPYGVGK